MNKIDGRFIEYNMFVEGKISTPPAASIVGEQYIVSDSPTGAWEGHTNQIAYYNATSWKFRTPHLGEEFYVKDGSGFVWYWDGNVFHTKNNTVNSNGLPIINYIGTSGSELPQTASKGDLFLNLSEAKIYTATEENTWNFGELTSLVKYDGTYFLDKSAKKIIKITSSMSDTWVTILIPNGGLFYYVPENRIYVLKANGSVSKGAPDAEAYVLTKPVDGFVDNVHINICGFNIPTPTSNNIGDTLLEITTSGGKDIARIYTANYKNTWQNSPSVDITEGSRYVVLDNCKIYSYTSKKENVIEDIIEETIPDNNMFLNKADGFLYVYKATTGTFVKVCDQPASSEEYTTETHVLTAEEVTAKFFNLTNSVKTGKETNILCFVQGVAQAAGIAFSVSGSTFGWADKTLEGNLSAGDVFIVHYVKA